MEDLEFCVDLEKLTARELVEQWKASWEAERLQWEQDILDLALDERTGGCAEDNWIEWTAHSCPSSR